MQPLPPRPTNQSLANEFNSMCAGQIFVQAVQNAKIYAKEKYGESFSNLTFEGSGMRARSVSVQVDPIEYQSIEIHFQNGASRKIGTVLPERTHLVDLKTAEEICNEIKGLIDQDCAAKVDSTTKKTNAFLNIVLGTLPGPYEIDPELTFDNKGIPPATHLLRGNDGIYHCAGMRISPDLIEKYFTEGFLGVVHVAFLVDKVVAISFDKEKLEQTMKKLYEGKQHWVQEFKKQ